MKMNKKGFTLIELLAVIIILAIIALIATPIVINVINRAQEGADLRSVEAYGKGLESAYYQYAIDHNATYTTVTTSLESYKEMSGNTVTCASGVWNDGKLTLTDCDVQSRDRNYDYTTDGGATK